MSEWKPGDVALVQMDRPAVGIWTGEFWAWSDGTGPYDGVSHCHRDVRARPAVVITLPNGALGGWPVLVDALKRAKESTGLDMVFGGLIDQIEAQTRPPKPPEPTGLGAVVEGCAYTDDIRRFVRSSSTKSQPWIDDEGCAHSWSEIEAVKILSPGWSE